MKWSLSLFFTLAFGFALVGQQPGPDGPKGPPDGPPPFGQDFFKKKGGFGKGPMGGPVKQLVKEFDKDGDGRLNSEERAAARAALKQRNDGKGGFPFGGKGGKGFPGKQNEPGKPGPKVSVADVKNYPDAKLYDPNVLRTVFIDFENKDWEAELADFYHSDVEVPATLTVDGKKYPNVGIHFRGASSYFTVSEGSKRSLNVSLDFVDTKQRLYGYKTLNLLNSHDDPTFMHTNLFSDVANKWLPTPKANYVKVVINGESWGVYVNVQQFNKEFLAENYGSGKGSRWKIKGSPGGGGSLEYLGDSVDAYKRMYELKSHDDTTAWPALINVCKVLNQTPADELPKAIEPILDVDNVLRFLAVDVALINDDGYWTRGSDYSLWRDANGKFHVAPHDMNEAFVAAKGPGMFGKGPPGGFPFGPPNGPPNGPSKEGNDEAKGQQGQPGKRPFGSGGGMKGLGVELDPLIGLDDARKPLRSKLLAVPAYNAKYLEYVRAVARDGLDWKYLGPLVKRNRDLIESEIALDTRKLTSLDAFQRLTTDTAERGERGFGGAMNLRAFADQRRAYLLSYEEGKKAP